ncbi:hypothetical protein [Spiribacter vilamensis]|uniref:Uncharacterized protein n=1 Tax=Spiribacter vilamensis TaxID=531306 RepID=A0A4Q8D1A8_9GAMM|nr:hypothetical protein [Spiribacter vilamensis]RZU99082.1 hypothetical protein EV698_1361 [Spiribacter vilamensis]TVO61920.1 hypothetical protein FPL09_07400 [Spiribacter vilamensis]
MDQTAGRVPIRLAGAGLIAVGLIVAVLGGLLLLSAANAHNAQRFLSDWAKTGREPAPEAFAAAESAAIQAIRLYPGATGEGWDRLGRVYDWAHWRQPIADQALPSTPIRPARILAAPVGAAGADDPRTTRLRALYAHQRAVELRPLWPYGMARLAFARLRAGGTGEQLDSLIREAFRLGPWRPSVNRRLTEVGLLGWRWLEPETRDVVLENARRTVRFSKSDERWVLNLAEATGKRLLIETLVLP